MDGTRKVHVNDDSANEALRASGQYTNNWVSTSKYTYYNFLPKTLFEFFRVVANCYFLVISILQLSTTWSPTNPYTTAGPLLIVLIVSMVKQGLEDKKRHEADAIQNSRECQVVSAGGKLVNKQWQHVVVGDILFLKDKDELPADVLILATSEEEGRCFVETCNLDGETNLKRRTALEPIAKLIGFRGLNDPVLDTSVHMQSCLQLKATVEYEQPNNRLYNFTGRISTLKLSESVPIGPNNIVLRGFFGAATTSLVSTRLSLMSYAAGVVLFAGKESKLMQNARSTPSKQSNVYKMVNRCIVLIFLTQLALCTISALAFTSWVNHYKGRVWYLPFIALDFSAFFTFLILYNNL
ncbi:P-type ATPase (P-ATPase) Superfamily, partial [Achlya hypogyna]